eukprot:gene27055-32690_t
MYSDVAVQGHRKALLNLLNALDDQFSNIFSNGTTGVAFLVTKPLSKKVFENFIYISAIFLTNIPRKESNLSESWEESAKVPLTSTFTVARTTDAGVIAATTAKESTKGGTGQPEKLVEDLRAELKFSAYDLKKSINRMDGGLTRLPQDKLRDSAGIKFGKDSFKPFVAKFLLDLVYLSRPSSGPDYDETLYLEEALRELRRRLL